MKTDMKGLAKTLRTAAGRVDAVIRQAEGESAIEALAIARELSTGTQSAESLRKLGHPYARRNPRPVPGQAAAVVNQQTKNFSRSWYRVGTRRDGAIRVTSIRNRATYYPYLRLGTRHMIARDIPGEVSKRIATGRKKRLRAAILSLFK